MSQSAKFFITHSCKDLEFAERLRDDLHASGLDGFFDMYSIQPGDDLVARINKGLEECDVYIPILSFAALESPWCKEEISAAISLGNQPSRKGRPRIISVLVEDCAAMIPPLLQNRVYLRFDVAYLSALLELLEKGFGIDPASHIRRARMWNGPRLYTGTGKDKGDQIWWGTCETLIFAEKDRGKTLIVSVESCKQYGYGPRMPCIELWSGGYNGKNVAGWVESRVHVTRTNEENRSPLTWQIEPGVYTVYFVDHKRLDRPYESIRLGYRMEDDIPDYDILYQTKVRSMEDDGTSSDGSAV